MKRTSYGAPLVDGHERKMDWKRFVHDILTFRTHVWWAQFVIIVTALALIVFLRSTVWFWPLLLILVLSVGSIVDISSHEWYHISFVASSTVLLILMHTYVAANSSLTFLPH